MNDEFEPIPSHFFERGPYEVWAYKIPRQYNERKVKIAGNLCWESAKAFNWPNAEIRKDGQVVTQEELE